MQRFVLLDSVQRDYLLALLGTSASSRALSNGHAQHQPSTSGQSLVFPHGKQFNRSFGIATMLDSFTQEPAALSTCYHSTCSTSVCSEDLAVCDLACSPVNALGSLQICGLSYAGRTEDVSAGAEQASRISAIKELFPDYGDGFLAECLSAFGQKPERVINALLEGSLPPHLSSLDPSMPLQALTQTSRGKGKQETEGLTAGCAKLYPITFGQYLLPVACPILTCVHQCEAAALSSGMVVRCSCIAYHRGV